METLLENNEEIARKRFLKLRSRFKNDSSLFEDYKLVVNNYLSEKIIERVPFEEENLEHNIFYLPHRAVIRTDKTTSKLRIVFDASSHAKSQLSLNDCLHTGLNFIPNLFFLLIKFRVNPIAFVADIKMAFLMIEIDESERDFTRFFWDENPGIDLENKRLDIFRMTRVLFGSLYVDDFLCGNVSVQAALTTCIESKQILEDASMDLRKWRTNSSELNQRLKNLNFEVDDHKESLNTLIASKILGVVWNEKSDTFYFDSSDLGTFLSKRINTKRYLLQAAGRLFDPVGFIGPYTIRIKCLIQEIWCLGLDWDDKLPKQLEVSWKKWCNEIHYLSEIKIPRYYFQNFLPSNATTIQLHCFSDASKKAYGTVAYLRLELNDGNIISSFVASKGRVAPLKTLSIPRLELMGALLSARLSDKIATALILPVSRFYWTDSSITYYWIKGDFNRHKVFVKNRIKEIQKLSDPKEWRYCKGKDYPADLISRGLPLNDLKNNKIWWHGPKWLTMKQTEWPLFSEPIIETEINNDKLELKKSINTLRKSWIGLRWSYNHETKFKRSRVTLKSYIAIFICFSTKATHLEVVSNLTTEAFLACLRRFIARRSKPSVIWSDNATNFKGARNILSEWNEICKSNRIQLFSAEEGIEWNFIPPASPHFGGLWEANIKSMKRILLRVAKSAIMNFEELTTLMAQIEAVLNSRPLSPLSSDPNDLNHLTPGHFLTNCAISSFPEPYTASDSLSYHSMWKLVQSLRDKFWNRWSTEYLTHLQTRAKWNPNLMGNQLVPLKDPNTKPLDWPMGRILEVFPVVMVL
ncbi:uncharacterized protein TNCV_4824091 [Trichonephila clavipes]|nr:uncharacterized protein TNCV_4824091 [Trichonephila clavipes]